MEEKNIKKPNLSDYVYILFKWKKFIIINVIIVGILAIAFSLLQPVTYKATTVIMSAPESQMGLGGLTGLLSGKSSSTASIGAKLFGISSTSDDILYGILNSRTALTDVINKFHLMKYYEIEDNNMDKVLRAFKNDVNFEPDEHGMIQINVINKSPKTSAAIANYFVELLDSLNIKINIEQAHNNRVFIEKRYDKNIQDLKSSEDSMYVFQKKYGVFAVPEQVEAAVKASATLEAQLVQQELMQQTIERQYGISSPQYREIMEQVNFIKNKIENLKTEKKINFPTNVFLPFKEIPDLSLKYYRYYRDIEIQTKIMEVILPMYEQAKVDEQKSMPTVLVIDKAVPPELKYAPKRAFIVIGILLLFMFFLIPFIFWGEVAVQRENYRNPLQEKESHFFVKILKFYRIKI